MYRITHEETQKQGTEYRNNYPPFHPYSLSSSQKLKIGEQFANILSTQNGPDFDDYSIYDNNKVETFLSYLPKGSKVLLLGVGTGRETKVALDLGLDAYGTTFGSRNVEFGKRYLGLSAERHIEVANEVLPFAKESFDAVAGFQLFEHCMAPLLFLLEQGRVLKYGGKLILEWPDATHSGGENPHHQICYAPGQARDLLLKAGFKDVKLFSSPGISLPDGMLWNAMCGTIPIVEGTKTTSCLSYVTRAWSY
jgi:SAM-dependent methyltransferase